MVPELAVAKQGKATMSDLSAVVFSWDWVTADAHPGVRHKLGFVDVLSTDALKCPPRARIPLGHDGVPRVDLQIIEVKNSAQYNIFPRKVLLFAVGKFDQVESLS